MRYARLKQGSRPAKVTPFAGRAERASATFGQTTSPTRRMTPSCAHPGEDCHSHGIVAFAICESCGQVIEFHDHEVDHRLMSWVRSQKFKPAKTTIEIRGTCEACAA